MIHLILLLFFSINGINGSHFNGGAITWTPVDTTNSSVIITITQSYSWTYPTVSCTTDVPVSSGRSNANLTCIANCSTDGGYSSSPIDILTDCTSFSSALDTMSSERSVNITLAIGAYFYLAYQGSAWRDLYASSIGSLDWTISTLIDLRVRPDGIINSPPVSNVLSPQYVVFNTTSLIPVPVSDVNAGDDVRCRWAKNNTNGFINECNKICYPRGLPNDTTLSNCTISFTGKVPNTCYPIPLQIEDFINTTSTDPMSSVPVQILICVLPTPACAILPAMVPMADCLEVQVGATTNFSLYVMNLCNSTASITDVIISKPISGMSAGKVRNSTTGSSLAYIQLSWTPQMSQVGTQQLCAYAYNSLLVRSSEYCVTFNVTTSSPNCPSTTTTTTDTTATTQTTQTTQATQNSNTINTAMVAGLSLLGVSSSLGCFFCWIYYYVRSAKRSRRNKKKDEDSLGKQSYSHLLSSDASKEVSFQSSNITYPGLKMKRLNDAKSFFPLTASTFLSNASNNQTSLTIIGENNDSGLEHSFDTVTVENVAKKNKTKSVTKPYQNKIFTSGTSVNLDINKMHDSSSKLFASTSRVGDLIVEDAAASVVGGHSVNINRVIKIGTSVTSKQPSAPVDPQDVMKKRGIHVIKPNFGSNEGPFSHIGSLGSVGFHKPKGLPSDIKSEQHNEAVGSQNSGNQNSSGKVAVTVVSRRQIRARHHVSKYKRNDVNIAN